MEITEQVHGPEALHEPSVLVLSRAGVHGVCKPCTRVIAFCKKLDVLPSYPDNLRGALPDL